MESSIQIKILQILKEKVKNGYSILELQEIYELLPKNMLIEQSEIKDVLRQLQDEGYVSIKYLDNETCCLNLLQMGRVQATKMLEKEGTEKNSNVICTVDKQANVLQAKENKINIKNLALQFIASFSGGFLAGIITLIVVLSSR